MRFDDVTRAVGRLAAGGAAGRFSFRLDAQIDHLLLDEFQDTSPAQWQAVRPFASRVCDASDARSFYCVGDVKQAIYGWRGGVAEIFDAVADELAIGRGPSLTKSYRSSPVITQTVNRIFTNLTRHGSLGRSQAAVEDWVKRFPEHETARGELPGYACLRSGPPGDKKSEQTANQLEWTAAYIAELTAACPGRSVGVLTRTNDAVAQLIFSLRSREVAASEEGGNPLTDSAAVELVLSLLQLADHPGDSVARFHLAESPLGVELGLAGADQHQAAGALSRQVRRRLIDEGYGPVIYDWAGRLATSCNRREWSRLKQLVELAYGYQPRSTLRPSDFIRFVKHQRVADPTAAGRAGDDRA